MTSASVTNYECLNISGYYMRRGQCEHEEEGVEWTEIANIDVGSEFTHLTASVCLLNLTCFPYFLMHSEFIIFRNIFLFMRLRVILLLI